MPRILSRNCVRRRYIMGGGSSMISLSSYHNRSVIRGQIRQQQAASIAPRHSPLAPSLVHGHPSSSEGRFRMEKMMMMMIPASSTSDLHRRSNNKMDCMPSPTLTASTMPMNTPPLSSSSFCSSSSYYQYLPPPSLSHDSMETPKIRRAVILERPASKSTSTIINSFLPRSRGGDEWGQFVDVAHAEEELERHSQFLKLSSKERSNRYAYVNRL
mmetsp:Transcript_21808/g.20939  ORF Transcript_21808/g.20939 Transcript_21808/m.20939 type:complete len:214 (-) Transcript_21808:97-738(-)